MISERWPPYTTMLCIAIGVPLFFGYLRRALPDYASWINLVGNTAWVGIYLWARSVVKGQRKTEVVFLCLAVVMGLLAFRQLYLLVGYRD